MLVRYDTDLVVFKDTRLFREKKWVFEVTSWYRNFIDTYFTMRISQFVQKVATVLDLVPHSDLHRLNQLELVCGLLLGLLLNQVIEALAPPHPYLVRMGLEVAGDVDLDKVTAKGV